MLVEVALMATYYAGKFAGRPTASGELFYLNKMTAASIDFKVGQAPYYLKVRRGKRVLLVRVNDRCPIPGRLDLSPAAARYLGVLELGKARVWVTKVP